MVFPSSQCMHCQALSSFPLKRTAGITFLGLGSGQACILANDVRDYMRELIKSDHNKNIFPIENHEPSYSNYLTVKIQSQSRMSASHTRKLQVDSKIRRPPKQEHLDTYFMPYERTVQAVPFYSRKKRQLKAKNIYYSKIQYDPNNYNQYTQTEQYDDQLRDQIPLADFITDITVEPVINDNKFTNFNPEQYSLNESEKVKVVEQKYFPLQNYYNYIWAMKSKEEVFRLAETTQQKAKDILKERQSKRRRANYVESTDNNNQPLIKETRKVKGFYQSRFDPDGKAYQSRHRSKELAPVYQEFKDGHPQINTFDMKEKEREKILGTFAAKYFM